MPQRLQCKKKLYMQRNIELEDLQNYRQSMTTLLLLTYWKKRLLKN